MLLEAGLMSHQCNQFIIKDGVFLRDFDLMYQHVEDPWDQRKAHRDDLVNNMAFEILKHWSLQQTHQIKRILDIGCADGYYAPFLMRATQQQSVSYVGSDISSTVIERAKKSFLNDSVGAEHAEFLVDDIRVLNPHFVKTFDLIFSAKTLYYVAPEIDQALRNITEYLNVGGILCFTYNQTPDAFTNQWLTYDLLREKILKAGYNEQYFVEMNRFQSETFAIGVFQKE